MISGDAATVWALTARHRLLHIDTATGETTEILPPLGVIRGQQGPTVPGSAVLLRGSGFSPEMQVMADGDSLPVVDVIPEGLWFQTPWEWASLDFRSRRLQVRTADNPFESLGAIGSPSLLRPAFALERDPNSPAETIIKAVHHDFLRLVTAQDPARPGETVHVYLTGLGPLDQPVPTGAPGPIDPPARPLTPFACYAGTTQFSAFTGLVVPFLAYAPGLVGVYQADITLPEVLPSGYIVIRCAAGDLITSGFLPAAAVGQR